MLATLQTFFADIAQDVYSFLIAIAIFKLFYWWTHRKQATGPRPLVKKVSHDFSSASEDTDKSSRSRISTNSRSRTAADKWTNGISSRPMRPGSSGSEWNPKAAVYVPNSTGEPVGENSQKVQQSIMRFKEVLEDWETKQKNLEDDALSHLQDAIAGLAPQDAAMVQKLLDSKAGEAEPASQSGKPFRPFNEGGRAPESDWRNRDRGPASMGARRRGPAGAPKEAEQAEVEGAGDSLRANLLELASMDQTRVIMVRKINQIGLNSPKVLETHFAKFGTIERVMVSHCMAKNSSGIKRLRPAALGFLVMSTAEEAQAVLAQGEIQSVQGVNITVGIFESHPV